MDKFSMTKLYYSNKYNIYFKQLLSKFFRLSKMDQANIDILLQMIKQGKSDKEIVLFFRNFRSTESISYDDIFRAKKITNIIYKFISANIKKINNYLDIGCNNGQVTVSLGKELNLHKNQIYGIDIESFGVQDIVPISGFNYKTYDGRNIPYQNNYFDFITVMMVMHHVKDVDYFMREINRVTKKNGLLLIKEHNSYSAYIDWLIRLEHLLYDVFNYDISYDYFYKTYSQYVNNKNSLKNLLIKYGFKFIKSSDHHFLKKYHPINPTQTYYSLYRKISDIDENNNIIN